jgi:hypothetical protein
VRFRVRLIDSDIMACEGDEGSRVSAATRPRHALATVMPDGTVLPGDVDRPLDRLAPPLVSLDTNQRVSRSKSPAACKLVMWSRMTRG